MKDLWRALDHPDDDGRTLRSAGWCLSRFSEDLGRDVEKVRQLLDFGRALRSSDALGRQVAEERLMDDLIYLTGNCSNVLEDAGISRLRGFDVAFQAPADCQPVLGVLQALHDYGLECLQFRRSRDSFGGRRRAMAFEILARLGRVVDLPEVERLARQALGKNQSVEAREAAEFLKEYYCGRGVAPDDATTDELLSLAQRTHSRSTVFSALNVLVETGTISEFEALDRMDDWKDRNR